MDYYSLPNDSVFLISQKALVMNAKNEVLLLQITADDYSPECRNTWDIPGGLLEFAEARDAGLTREVAEETGLTVTVGKLLAINDFIMPRFIFTDHEKQARIMSMAYLCHATDDDEVQMSDEHQAFQWVPLDTVRSQVLSPHSRPLIEKCLTALNA